jgi:hypothetical protein
LLFICCGYFNAFIAASHCFDVLLHTAAAAAAVRDVFKAGASLYGVADIELLAKHTHKFESRWGA